VTQYLVETFGSDAPYACLLAGKISDPPKLVRNQFGTWTSFFGAGDVRSMETSTWSNTSESERQSSDPDATTHLN